MEHVGGSRLDRRTAVILHDTAGQGSQWWGCAERAGQGRSLKNPVCGLLPSKVGLLNADWCICHSVLVARPPVAGPVQTCPSTPLTEEPAYIRFDVCTGLWHGISSKSLARIYFLIVIQEVIQKHSMFASVKPTQCWLCRGDLHGGGWDTLQELHLPPSLLHSRLHVAIALGCRSTRVISPPDILRYVNSIIYAISLDT
eukprot:365329-Chlamydomonas_euryale.AAC.14